jgi:hypothetical protein
VDFWGLRFTCTCVQSASLPFFPHGWPFYDECMINVRLFSRFWRGLTQTPLLFFVVPLNFFMWLQYLTDNFTEFQLASIGSFILHEGVFFLSGLPYLFMEMWGFKKYKIQVSWFLCLTEWMKPNWSHLRTPQNLCTNFLFSLIGNL